MLISRSLVMPSTRDNGLQHTLRHVEVDVQPLKSVSIALLASLLALAAIWGAAPYGILPDHFSRPPHVPVDFIGD